VTAGPRARPGGSHPARIAAAGALVAVALAVLAVLLPDATARLRAAWFDLCQRVAPRSVESMPAVVVEIDERSIAAVGRWPWPRSRLAALVSAIAGHDPAVIGIDILMPEADPLSPDRIVASLGPEATEVRRLALSLPSNDTVLARTIAAAPVVLVVAGMPHATGRALHASPVLIRRVAATTEDAAPAQGLRLARYPGALTSLPELDRAASGWGLISVDPDAGVVRRIPLIAGIDGTLLPALAIEMLRVASSAPAVRLRASDSVVEGIEIADRVVATEADGAVHVHFSPRNAKRFVSAIDVLEGRIDPERLARKLVVIGVTGVGLGDWQATPIGERMPGSEIHAQLLESLFDGTTLVRPGWAAPVELAAFGLLAALLIVVTTRRSPVGAAILAFGSLSLLGGGAFLLFHSRQLLFDAATPGAGLLFVFGSTLVLTLADARRQKRALEREMQRQRERSARIAGELEAARRIQTGTLPRADLLRGDRRFDLGASMQPAAEVGGDLYDFFRLDERRLFLIVGDVAGKGLSASIFMAVSKALCKASMLRAPDVDVATLLTTANVEIARDNPEFLFVTAFAAILDLDTGELAFCNAGHEPPWVVGRRDAAARRIDGSGGPPLCVVDGYRYAGGCHRLQPGDLLVVVSDGVTEAVDGAGRMYGSDRVAMRLVALRGVDAGAIVEALRADVAAFTGGSAPGDDMTVLALRWLGPRDPAAAGP
jgi:serine phosphatase RsbU (regulator of sigma subunit)